MVRPSPGRVLSVLVALAVLLPTGAAAVPIGPEYPLPGGPGEWHGGSTCFALSDAEAAMGKAAGIGPHDNDTLVAGQTWHFGGGSDPAQTGTDCPFSATPTSLPAFDTERFQRLFWGMRVAPTLALDGAVDNAEGTVETLVLNPTASNLTGGLLVWEGSTRMTWCKNLPPNPCVMATTPVNTRFELRATVLEGTTPVPLVDPTTVDVADPVGGLVEVTPALTNFKVNLVMLADDPSTAGSELVPAITMYNLLNHPIGSSTQMGFGAGFRWLSRPPTGTIDGAVPVEKQPRTFTATATDPDGEPGQVLTYAWDLDDGDDLFDDGTTQAVERIYSAGTHTIRVAVTDDEGATGILTRTFTVPDATRPTVTLTLPSQSLGAVRRSGLKGSLWVNEPATARLKATIPSTLANRLGLRNPVASKTLTFTAAGTKSFALTLTTKAKDKLRRLNEVRFTVTARVTDLAGNVRTVSKSITVKK